MRFRMGAALCLIIAMAGTSCSDDSKGSAGTTSRPDRTESTTTTEAVATPTASAGCEVPPAVLPGETKVEMMSGEANRWYFRHIPPAYDGTSPLPLVIDFHGYSEGAAVHVQMSKLGLYGDEHDFVTVTPHGQGTVPRWEEALGSADHVFVEEMLDALEQDLCLDLDRVFVTGFSNGAFMTSAVACTLNDRVAAVAPVAGIRDIEGCEVNRPVPVIAFHGTEDGFVTYDGGFGEDAAALPAPDGSGKTLGELGVGAEETADPSIPEISAAWASRNGCEETPDESEVAADVALLEFDCPDGAETQLYRVSGGGHSWPGSELSKGIEPVVGHTTFSIDANELMWQFFEDHPREDT